MSTRDASAARGVLDAWTAAWNDSDAEALAALYAERPYFWGSTPDLVTDRTGVRSYFERQLSAQHRPRVVFELVAERELTPDVSELAARAIFDIPGGRTAAIRLTLTIAGQGDRWSVVTHHASPG